MALSPMMQHYFNIKNQYQDCIVLYRLGDFYEMFFEDAEEASKVLDLTLTGRDCGLEERAPMCGVPYHAVEGYIAKLISAGYKVAICEQLTTPEESGNKMVERDVTRVITPGTIFEGELLNESTNNYLACAYSDETTSAIAWCDISTGEFSFVDFNGIEDIERHLLSIHPVEIITNSIIYELSQEYPYMLSEDIPPIQKFGDFAFNYESAYTTLCKQFGVKNLDSFNFKDKKHGIIAAGALIQYLLITQKRNLIHINDLKYVESTVYMTLDNNAIRNLELTSTIRDSKKKGSLLWVLDKTKTSMGARKLRRWIEKPLIDDKMINLRLDAVEELVNKDNIRFLCGDIMSPFQDLERLVSKISYGTINPKDCLAIKNVLKDLPELKLVLAATDSNLLLSLKKKIDPLKDLCNLLEKAIDPEAPAIMKDGGFIREGYSQDLDDYRSIETEGKKWLADIEAKEKEATGIKSLKVRYNKVFGYYIEVTNLYKDQIPAHYIRKQTLTNGERYITAELKEIEEKILNSTDLALKLENQIFEKIKSQLANNISTLLNDADLISTLDVLVSFAEASFDYDYAKPVIHKKLKSIEIRKGRHPVVERLLRYANFVPNDTYFDAGNKTMIITGPNMGGKSTYMRQVAIITLMAHMGCFVPAESANIAITDRIFTRVGASDDLGSGQSTFMIEMTEVASIIKNATSKSLLILDEIGRGTSTWDGMSIAWAVLEYVTNMIKCNTLFATHYHELTKLEGIITTAHNFRVMVKELSEAIIFLHKIERGSANRSFGIEVSKLAGIPSVVTNRAKEILSKLEKTDFLSDPNSMMLDGIGKQKAQQTSFFVNENTEIINILKELDINNCSPMQAFNLLQNLKEKVTK